MRWGRKVGFNPVVEEVEVDRDVAEEIECRLARWVNWKLFVESHGASVTLRPQTRLILRHWGDGITAFGLGPEQAARLLRWAEAAAARKAARRQEPRAEQDGTSPTECSSAERLAGGGPAQPVKPPAADRDSGSGRLGGGCDAEQVQRRDVA